VRTRGVWLGAVALLTWLLLYTQVPSTSVFNNDQNAYVGGAVALASGNGYRFEPYIDLPKIGMYPPGYSAWLSLFWRLDQPLEANTYRLQQANWIVAGAFLCVLGLFFWKTGAPVELATAVLAALGTSVMLTQSMLSLGADLMFAAGSCLLALIVWAYPDGGQGGDARRRLTWWWFAVGVLVAVLYLIKTAALAYAVGLGAFGLWRGDLRRAVPLALFAGPIAPVVVIWFLFTSGVPTYGSYFGTRLVDAGGFAGYAIECAQRAGQYLSGRWLVEAMLSAPDRLSAARSLGFPAMGEGLAFLLGLGLMVPVALGIRRGVEHPRDLAGLCILAVWALQFMLWPFYLGARVGIALLPFLAGWMWRGLPSRRLRLAVALVLVVNVPVNVWLSSKIARAQAADAGPALASLREAAAWINGADGRTPLVAAGRDVPLVHLYAYLGRRMLTNPTPVPDTRYVDVRPDQQQNQWADYLILDRSFDPKAHAGVQFETHRTFGQWSVVSPVR